MVISLIHVLVALIIVCVLLYVTRLLLGAFAVREPFATLIYVVVILIGLLIFLQAFGFLGSFGTVRLSMSLVR